MSRHIERTFLFVFGCVCGWLIAVANSSPAHAQVPLAGANISAPSENVVYIAGSFGPVKRCEKAGPAWTCSDVK